MKTMQMPGPDFVGWLKLVGGDVIDKGKWKPDGEDDTRYSITFAGGGQTAKNWIPKVLWDQIEEGDQVLLGQKQFIDKRGDVKDVGDGGIISINGDLIDKTALSTASVPTATTSTTPPANGRSK